MDEHTLNDLLECSVCLERLDTSSKVLPCQHTFCRKCLEVILCSRQELRCPECRILVDVKIEALPPNVLLMRILEGMKNAATAKTQQQQLAATAAACDNVQQILTEVQQQQMQQMKLKQQQQQKQILQYQQQHKPQQQQPHQQQQNQNQQPQHQQQQQPQAAAQQRRCLLPHAYALYDFNSAESSDLHFKKGDLILLKGKIDINWYVGQLNGQEGTFPINYVQVIVPLPTPQCVALYDFKMGPNEEEGCLSFKKGTRIHVLRRVDHNWAEGRIAAAIGIFPIAFVELNALAKQLLDSCVVLPNSPPPAAPLSTSSNMHGLQQQKPPVDAATQARNLPAIPLLDATSGISQPNASDTNSSSSVSSSQTTSPNSTNASSTCTTSTSSPNCNCASMPNSPVQSLPNTPQHIVVATASASVRYRGDRKEKRHSLNALLSAGSGSGSNSPTLSVLQSNRHSAEILSMPSEHTGASNAAQHVQPDAAMSTREQQQQSPSTVGTTHARVNVLKMGGQQQLPPNLPWSYLALYPYKPRKCDELELKKGCVYIVTERCLDGWFKGKNWQDVSGVFPGNYVAPLRNRDQQQLMHQWKYVPLQAAAAPATIAVNAQQAAGNQQQAAAPRQLPELPPRQPEANAANVPTNAATCNSSSVWTKPLSHTVEAFFSRSKNSQHATTQAAPAAITTTTGINTAAECKEKDVKPKDASSCSASAAVSLMKRLTHIKTRSKSPSSNAGAVQQQQQQQQHANIMYALENENSLTAPLSATHVRLQPAVHVRSGSCPSQLLQSLPMELNAANTKTATHAQLQEHMLSHQQQQQQQQQSLPQVNSYGSQRLKGHKERALLPQNSRYANDVSLQASYNNSQQQQQQHQKQQQPAVAAATTTALLSKCAHQQQLHSNNYNVHHRKSQSLDANTLLCTAATLPPNSSGLMAATAAIVASATTKSTQSNARESRFRCVVPYPPNSDIELELHVGDIIYVQRKQKNGWYKGTHARTQKTGLFPASFVEPDI